MTLTYKQAFLAAYTLLDDLYEQRKYDAFMLLLSDMNPFVFLDEAPADPAVWNEWLKNAKLNQQGGMLTELGAFRSLISFLQCNAQIYGYDLEAIVNDLQSIQFQKRWKQLACKASEI